MFRTQTGQTGRDAYVNELAAIGNEFRALKRRYDQLRETIKAEAPDATVAIEYHVPSTGVRSTESQGLSHLLDCTGLGDTERAIDLIRRADHIEAKPAAVAVTIIGPNLRDQSKGSFHVHASGCADIARMAKRDPAYADASWTIEASTRDDVVLEVYSDMIEANDRDPIEDYRDDLHFFPCCAQLPQS